MNSHKHPLIISILVFCFAVFSCSNSDDVEVTTLKVNHFRQSGEGSFTSLFLLTQEGNDINTHKWNMFYDRIEGFQHQLGYVYTLKVEKRFIENPPADGSSYLYSLIDVLSKEKVTADTYFEIILSRTYDDGGFKSFVIEDIEPLKFRFIDQTMVNCDNIVCNDLKERLNLKEGLTGVFAHEFDNVLRLVEIKQN